MNVLYEEGIIKGIGDEWLFKWGMFKYKVTKKHNTKINQKYFLKSAGVDCVLDTKDDINSKNHPWPSEK